MRETATSSQALTVEGVFSTGQAVDTYRAVAVGIKPVGSLGCERYDLVEFASHRCLSDV